MTQNVGRLLHEMKGKDNHQEFWQAYMVETHSLKVRTQVTSLLVPLVGAWTCAKYYDIGVKKTKSNSTLYKN